MGGDRNEPLGRGYGGHLGASRGGHGDHGGPAVPRPPHDRGQSHATLGAVGRGCTTAGLASLCLAALTLPAVCGGLQVGRHGLPRPWPPSTPGQLQLLPEKGRVHSSTRRLPQIREPLHPIHNFKKGREGNGRMVTAALVGHPHPVLCALQTAGRRHPPRPRRRQGLTWVKPPTPESLPKAVYALRSPPLPGGEERVTGRRPCEDTSWRLACAHTAAPVGAPPGAAQRPVDKRAPSTPPDANPTARGGTAPSSAPTPSPSLLRPRMFSVASPGCQALRDGPGKGLEAARLRARAGPSQR